MRDVGAHSAPRGSGGCPKELWGGKNASQILHESGIARIFPQLDLAGVDGEWDEGAADRVLDLLCRAGSSSYAVGGER